MALFNLFGSIFQVPETAAKDGSVFYSPRDRYKQHTPKGKVRKSDIGSPTNFTHLAHVGWSSVPFLNTGSDDDLKRLFNLAGITKDHLRDKQMSRRIFEVIEENGGIEAVKETLRMTTVDRPCTRSRLRSWSSSCLTPSKKLNCAILQSPKASKITATVASPAYSLPSLRASPLQSNFPKHSLQHSGLSQSLHLVKERKRSTGNPPLPPKPNLKKCSQTMVPPQPCSLIVPSGKILQSVPLAVEKYCDKSKDAQKTASTTDVPPPPPPLPPFMKISENKQSSTSTKPPHMPQFQRLSQHVCTYKTVSNIEPLCQNDPHLFLDQIKQGVQLKSVVQSSKSGSVHCSSMVDALMVVLQKRHKAIQSSDDESDEWED